MNEVNVAAEVHRELAVVHEVLAVDLMDHASLSRLIPSSTHKLVSFFIVVFVVSIFEGIVVVEVATTTATTSLLNGMYE